MALSHLQTALESLEVLIATVSAAVGPNYSIDGQAVSRVGYLTELLAAREKLKAQIAEAQATEDPYEIVEELY
jgi:hypothetical protein